MISSGVHAFRNYILFRLLADQPAHAAPLAAPARTRSRARSSRTRRRSSDAVSIPVLCTGGFQTASVIERALRDGACDAVTIARPLVANNDLVRALRRGPRPAPRPCSYCNKCLFNVLENPLGCYDERRYASREEMIDEIYSVFDPPPFVEWPSHLTTSAERRKMPR